MLNTKLDSALLMDILERQSNPIVRVDCKNRLLYMQPAQNLCNWYSIIETAKANGLNAYVYLVYILTQLQSMKQSVKILRNYFLGV